LKVARSLLLLLCLLLPLAALAKIDFQDGPLGDLGGLAQVQVPKGWKFVPASSCKEFLDETNNLASGQEKGVLIEASRPEGMWLIFEWDGMGLVQGAGLERLDAESLEAQLKEAARQSNAVREQRSREAVDLLGWEAPPRYSPATQRLQWALRLSSKGKQFVNCHARMLGRRGVMKVVLAVDLSQPGQEARFEKVMQGFSFKPGSRYSDWQPGDKVAQGGLADLILGRRPAQGGLAGGLGLSLLACAVLGLGYWGLKRKHRQ